MAAADWAGALQALACSGNSMIDALLVNEQRSVLAALDGGGGADPAALERTLTMWLYRMNDADIEAREACARNCRAGSRC